MSLWGGSGRGVEVWTYGAVGGTTFAGRWEPSGSNAKPSKVESMVELMVEWSEFPSSSELTCPDGGGKLSDVDGEACPVVGAMPLFSGRSRMREDCSIPSSGGVERSALGSFVGRTNLGVVLCKVGSISFPSKLLEVLLVSATIVLRFSSVDPLVGGLGPVNKMADVEME